MSTKDYQSQDQDYANIWNRVEWHRFKKHSKIAFFKSKKFSKKFMKHDWKGEAKKVESLYFASKAIYAGASKDLPFKTLSLLGKLKSEGKFHSEIQQIIESNVIKYEGIFLKLDDLDNQPKIRKILRSYQFDRFAKVDLAA